MILSGLSTIISTLSVKICFFQVSRPDPGVLLGHGWKVYIGQFMKGQRCGELETAKKLPGLTIEQYGDERFICKRGGMDEQAKEQAQKGLKRAAVILAAGGHDLVILDEINVAVHFGLLTADPGRDREIEKVEGV
ncbi:MAG: cob(I)yrinic acid a,c-diamide adenosyltransferase, partial [Candidatus Wallbacteria bacterium]|nr:cob(I)yrinic acid a,c-diamide adenosyltransferase [Candidatus Wallbacteria bacterium]